MDGLNHMAMDHSNHDHANHMKHMNMDHNMDHIMPPDHDMSVNNTFQDDLIMVSLCQYHLKTICIS